jgi:hypothetical protein
MMHPIAKFLVGISVLWGLLPVYTAIFCLAYEAPVKTPDFKFLFWWMTPEMLVMIGLLTWILVGGGDSMGGDQDKTAEDVKEDEKTTETVEDEE